MSVRPTKHFLAVLAVSSGAALADIRIDVVPSVAPNAFGSPSWNEWLGNSLNALQNGSASAGTAGTPGYYEAAPVELSLSQLTVTSYPSWLGQSDPGTAFGPDFGGELGNRLHFGVRIVGDGQTQFSLSQVGFEMVSSDPLFNIWGGNLFGFSLPPGSFSSYSASYVGVQYGADGRLGGNDDVFITSGPSDQAVDAIFGRGPGNAWWADLGPTLNPPQAEDPGATLPDKIDWAFQTINDGLPFTIAGNYYLDMGWGLDDPAGTSSVVVSSATAAPIPEAGTSAAMAAVAVAMAGAWARRRHLKVANA
jgi:MYXO-CTERM domain-containing protein